MNYISMCIGTPKPYSRLDRLAAAVLFVEKGTPCFRTDWGKICVLPFRFTVYAYVVKTQNKHGTHKRSKWQLMLHPELDLIHTPLVTRPMSKTCKYINYKWDIWY